MIGPNQTRPGRFRIALLRWQYRFDRLSEPQRVLFGLAAMALVGATWLYVLGIGSALLLGQIEPLDELVEDAPTAPSTPTAVVVLLPTVAPATPVPIIPPTTTPATEVAKQLIGPPEVPNVPIVAVPRYVDAEPTKPRVVATPPVPAPTAAQPLRSPLPTASNGTNSHPQPRSSPLPGAPPLQTAQTAPAVPPARPTATVRVVPTPTPATSHPPVSTPALPTVRPGAGVAPLLPPLQPTALPR